MSNLRWSMVLSFFKIGTRLYYHTHRLAHFLGILWSRLLCTVIGPCGCHAVARPRPCWVVIGVCGIAAWQRCREWQIWPPALPGLPSWWGGGGEEVAQVWYGGAGSACHVGRGGHSGEICDGQPQGGFNRIRVMASVCLSPFQAASVWSSTGRHANWSQE